jgi:hypothetical protein
LYRRRRRRRDRCRGSILGGRGGKEEGGHNSFGLGIWSPEQQKNNAPQQQRHMCENIIRRHSPIIFVVKTKFSPSRFRRLMADSEMDFPILLKQRDKEIAALKADLRATRAQHTADLASTASAANDLVAAVKGTAHDGTTADIVSAATDLAVLVKAAADVAADQYAIIGHVEATEDHEIAADVVKAVNLGATADIDMPHGGAGRGEFASGVK